MAADIDPRLIALLRASLDFVDALRDLGIAGGIGVRLDRAGGERLMQIVEARGGTSVGVAGLAFEWPKALLSAALAANDNDARAIDGGTPALR